ncbi:MAG: hypothetical protein AMXMBFR7_39420 [Planctomycetota bacterium]
MRNQDLKELQIVQLLSEEEGLTQRDLFLRLGMAQGLVNLYLKRLARKGWIKLTTAPPKRMLYWLTPKGMSEKAQLSYDFVASSYRLFREAHKNASNTLHALALKHKARRVVLYGADPLAEVAAMSLGENRQQLVAVADEDAQGQAFLDRTVVGIDALDRLKFDAILFVKHARKDDAILLKLLATKGRVVNLFAPGVARAPARATRPARKDGA